MVATRGPIRHRRSLVLALAAGIVFISADRTRAADPPVTRGEIGKQALSTTATNLLNDRLTIRMPEGARVQARPVDIMSAPESEDDETRVTFDAGEERLVVMVHELFGLAGDDLDRDVQATVAQWGEKGAQYRLVRSPSKALRAVDVLPAPGKPQGTEAIFVRGMFVALPDSTVQTVFVYVNPEAAKDLAGCSAAAERILATVAPGARKLRADGGERRLATLAPDAEILVSVPKNVVVTTQLGRDFLVQRIRVLGRLGQSSDSIGLYLGHAPSFKPAKKASDGTLFGKRITWQAGGEGKELEALVELSRVAGPPDYAHVWIIASNDDRLAALKRVAESMKLVKKAKPAGAVK